MGTTEKSSVAEVSHGYFRRTYGQSVWARTLEKLTPEERAMTENLASNPNFPVYIDGKIFSAIVELQFNGSRSVAERELRTGGRRQADEMLDGLFSIFARFVSPQQAVKRAGSIMASVYTGVTTDSTMGADNLSAVIKVRGLGELSYIAPWVSGWMERAIERFGGKNPHVEEQNWAAGRNAADELVYEVRWE